MSETKFFLHRFIVWLVVIAFAWLAAGVMRFFLCFSLKKLSKNGKLCLRDHMLDFLSQRPFRHVMIFFALVWIVNDAQIHFPAGDEKIIFFLKQMLGIYGIMLGAMVFNAVVEGFLRWSKDRLEKKDERDILNEFFPLIRRIVRTIIWIIGGIISLSYVGIDVSAILISFGLAGAALALALKDMLENVISGVLIMLDRPFRIGDRIQLASGELGDVVEISLRSTRIMTFDQNYIIIPNTKLIGDKIVNLSFPNPKIRVMVELNVSYDTNLKKARQVMLDVASKFAGLVDDPPPVVYVGDLKDSSISLILYARASDYKEHWMLQNQLREAIFEEFQKEKIKIPFPQMDIHLKGDLPK